MLYVLYIFCNVKQTFVMFKTFRYKPLFVFMFSIAAFNCDGHFNNPYSSCNGRKLKQYVRHPKLFSRTVSPHDTLS